MAQSRLAGFRVRKDGLFSDGEQSPLDAADRPGFAGLDYFDERPDLALAVDLDKAGPGIGDIVAMQTVDGREKHYERAGRLHIEVDGKPVTLSVFREQTRGSHFLPFMDGTTGTDTYEGGRYLEPHILPDGKLGIDFNYAYNPYCAYSGGWSCPIVPAENRVSARIEAGERAYRRPTPSSIH